MFALPVCSQTYKVGQDSNQPQSSQPNSQKSLGWGSNIQNARLAHAAEEALRNHNYAAAADYAQRATQAAPNDAQLWFLLGYSARLAGRLQLSADAFNRGLRIAPSSLEGMSGLAQTYSKMGRRDEAEKLLTRTLSADPRRSEDARVLGEIFLQSGRYDQAASTLGRAEQAQPDARTELLLALAYEHMNQMDRANHYLDAAKRRSPYNPDVQRALAGFYRETGNYPASIAALKSLPNKTPDIMAELAYTYQLDGKREESAKLYSQAASQAPRDAALQLSAAQSQVTVGDADAAEPFLKRAAEVDPENYRLHAIRGQIALLQDRYQDALREYSAAADHLPEAPPEGPLYGIQLHMNLAEIDRNLLDQAAAHQQLETAKSKIDALNEQGAGREEFLRLRALINLNLGDLTAAEKDVQEALSLNGKDPNTLQLRGDILEKSGHPLDAAAAYRKVLAVDPNNRAALTALGYVSRETGHDKDAEKYFQRLAAAYPQSYEPYLSLGDMYTAHREFAKAESFYRKGYELAPHNSLIVAGGMNAAIESHHFPLAGEWLARATDTMRQEPHLMREEQRYLTWTQQYQRSADVGRQVIHKLPTDRDVIVYLGYDLLHLERYDELLQLTQKYDSVLPKEPDIPLLAGYVHKHNRQLQEAEQDFTRVLERDPNVVTAYVNRGFVRNDLHKSEGAAADFEAALHLDSKDGEAHLGLASASLALHRPQVALRQAELAEAGLGDSMSLHLIRGTAYNDLGDWTKAVPEYQAALKYAPNDATLHTALAGSFYGLRRYPEAIAELQKADKLSPGDSNVYAQFAMSYAQLREHDQAVRYIQAAEQHLQVLPPKKQTAIYVSNGEVLEMLGDENDAMQRFEKALSAPNGDRVGTRLAIARLMSGRGQANDVRRQIALALMEAQTSDAPPPTGSELMEAANLFLAIHDFELAEKYFQRALAAGANEASVRIGLANTYLAEGDTPRAQGQLSLLASNRDANSDPSYQYLLAKASMLRQEHRNARALTAFAQAAQAAGQDEVADRELLAAGRDEGMRINSHLSFLSTFSLAPVFEDTTVYPLDAKLDTTSSTTAPQGLLPLPRSSLESQWTGAYHLHFNGLPDFTGFFQTRNARGQISLPNANAIVNRDTTDYSFNFAVNPSIHLGTNILTFSGGIQQTIRRDAKDPIDMNQNLFRQFLYVSTSSFFNFLSVSGYAIHESGPFTLSGLSSRDLVGALEFRVGRPWGKTALVTGIGSRDEQFSPLIREFFYTSSYIGIERQVSDRFRFRAVAEDLRSWRVESDRYAIAQALRPAGSVEFIPARNWTVQGSFAYSRNMGFHAYDAVQSGFSVSYVRSIGRTYHEDGQDMELRYPIRFSFGMQQEDFFNFTGGNNHQLRPYISISLF